MIKICLDVDQQGNNRISVTGHAGYAPHGQDIVCAAVSTLVQAFIASVEKLTTDKIKVDMAAGKAVIQYGNLSAQGQVLVDSLFVGINMIADEFPDYVRVE